MLRFGLLWVLCATTPCLAAPIPKARVILLYVDGLRPDVLREMAREGWLPHLNATFLEHGLDIPNAFSVFPSNTLIANGSLFTGLWSDSTGIKSQNQFERSTLKPKGQLSKWLPDGFIPEPPTRVLDLLDKYAPEQTHAFLVKRGIPTLASRLGKAYRFTTLPIAPINPPPYWLHRAINTIGPFGISTRLPHSLDVVNAHYAIDELIGDPDARVIAVWLPMVDKICHTSPTGQFGEARWTLILLDRLVGRLLGRLRQVRWDQHTYLMLVSDHGHLGGDPTQEGHRINRTCNLPRDWAYRHLGCNAKVVGREWMHPGVEKNRFIFFDNQGAGQAKLFFPAGSYFNGPWRRNRLHELMQYEIRPEQGWINLLESLRGFRPPGWHEGDAPPVALILVKLAPGQLLVDGPGGAQALITIERALDGLERYRYQPVRRMSQSQNGIVQSEASLPGEDPLGYLHDPDFLTATGGAAWLTAPHTPDEWLQATAKTRYPDAVVAMATFFAWKPGVADLADVRDPDLVVTAAEGWSLRSDDGQGTDHGYPLAEAMRITWMLSGPNIRHGIVEAPQRIINILPTILELIGWPYDPKELDGRAIQDLYRSE